MPTIKELFKKQNVNLYGLSSKILIESRGFINPPRVAALLTSSPNALADAIGNQIGGALGGNANRPSDTVFKSRAVFAKPVTLLAITHALLRDSVKKGRHYYIKDHPAPASIIAKIRQGGSSPLGVAANLAQNALNNFGSGAGLRKLANIFGKKEPSEGYGTEFQRVLPGLKPLKEDIKFSKYRQKYTRPTDSSILGKLKPVTKKLALLKHSGASESWTLEKRSGEHLKSWDDANNLINYQTKFEDTKELVDVKKQYSKTNQVWVTFKKYGNATIIPFAGAVSGISEDISPEWSDLKYVGSPFKVYRYGGVQRSLKFNLKLYYEDQNQKFSMIQKINYLKSLAFPYDEIAEMTYGDDKQTAQYAFTPNLVYVSIGDMYNDVLGVIESLSFSIDDNIPWPDMNPFEDNNGDNSLYPSVVNVSVSMKIIENHKTEKKGTVTKYKYDFDGNTYAGGKGMIIEETIEDESKRKAAEEKWLKDALKLFEKNSFKYK